MLLLPLPIVSDDSSMVCLSYDCSTFPNELIIHEPMATKALCYNLGEYVAIVVLQSKQKSPLTLDELSCHVVNVSVLEVYLAVVVLLIYLLKHYSEPSIVLWEHRYLGGQFDRQIVRDCVLEARVGELAYRFLAVVHSHKHTSILLLREPVNRLVPAHRAVIRTECQIQLACLDGPLISGVELVAVAVACYHDLVLPVRQKARDPLE